MGALVSAMTNPQAAVGNTLGVSKGMERRVVLALVVVGVDR